ncbi:7396_t:CDS:2, partial [Cetraspora pellucida]
KTKKRHECALLMDHNELGETLSDVNKVIKSEYASPEISDEENDVDVFYIVQISWKNQRLCELIQKLD